MRQGGSVSFPLVVVTLVLVCRRELSTSVSLVVCSKVRQADHGDWTVRFSYDAEQGGWTSNDRIRPPSGSRP